MGNIKNETKIKEMKDYFGTESLETIASKLGYSSTTANNWYGKKGVSSTAYNKFKALASKNIRNNKDVIHITYYPNVIASAGYGAINTQLESKIIEFDKNYFTDILGINVFKNLEMVKVLGDSMMPFVNDGEYAIIQKRSKAKNNEVVIANINGDVYVKRMIKDITKKQVRFVSFNEAYPDIVLKNEELDGVAIIGVVIAKFDMKVKIF